ncbi:MAG: hypothetical protein EPGJADBJ_05127 [Saprospiraceae bacterium]|nr:hypothetical protein [Saprospiraceae bacterium]
MNFWKKVCAQYQFAKERRLTQLLFNTIIVLTVIVALLYQPNLGDFWDKSVGTISSIATFFIAIFLWLNDLSRDWKDSLEKRLFVDFNYRDLTGIQKPAMKCVGAFLSGEADIRAWGQQIGKQMNDQKILDFKPVPIQRDGLPIFDETEKCFFKPYYLTILLDSDSDGLPTLCDRVRSKIKSNQFLVWSRQHNMTDEWVDIPI